MTSTIAYRDRRDPDPKVVRPDGLAAVKHISFPVHNSSVVTCLVLSGERIISASDDHTILVYSPATGDLLQKLEGHEGGVWALAVYKDTLVTGSTDRTLRIWNLADGGKCTHVFGGHESTIRALAIALPEVIDIQRDGTDTVREEWPKRPIIVTGSRDHKLGLWNLPLPGEAEFYSPDPDIEESEVSSNPYHLKFLEGHQHAIRDLAAKGRVVVSGSYDHDVRVWDAVNGTCKWVLVGHTSKVYAVALDSERDQVISSSMDSTIRIWSLQTGECKHVLTGHTSLVGLIAISPSYLVSAAADATLRTWNPETGELKHVLDAHRGAITCFQHDDGKILSGSDGTLKLWNIRDGTLIADLLSGVTGVWKVTSNNRWCVAASNRHDATFLGVWDFGEADDSIWPGDQNSEKEVGRIGE